MFNLFDVSQYHEPHIGPRDHKKRNDKPRQPNAAELKAYLCWVADRRGINVPSDAKFHPHGIESENLGGLVMEMPGYGEVQTVTMETLDDAGDVIASQTLPIEPKKGGVVWNREAVRKAHGPIAKPARKTRTKAAPPTCDINTPAPVQAEEPAPVDAIAARVEALETQLNAMAAKLERATLPATTGRAARTAAHVAAIKRSWAMRKAAREADAARRQVETHLQIGQAQYDAVKDELRQVQADLERAQGDAERVRGETASVNWKRRQTAMRARHMIKGQRGAANLWASQFATLRKSMADPSQPERASDIHRLMAERDQARTALAAVNARNEAQAKAIDDITAAYEVMVSRAARAEAAARRVNAA